LARRETRGSGAKGEQLHGIAQYRVMRGLCQGWNGVREWVRVGVEGGVEADEPALSV
jgi:hypothetical protein